MTKTREPNEPFSAFRLEAEGRNAYLGEGGVGGRRLFGGHVAAQAFLAAGLSIDPESGHRIHSLHSYFLRPGRGGVPIRYTVHPLKDGRNFSSRDVVAAQGEEVIFSLHASFTRPEPGISHQESRMPEAPDPETLGGELEDVPEQMLPFLESGPVEMRSCERESWTHRAAKESLRRLWMRPRGALSDDPLLHTAAVIYASDRSLIRTGARLHELKGQWRGGASLDHCMWFHRELRFDDWWLYVMDSPVAHEARALIHGAMYTRDGTRVVSVVQEGLIRT